eukprot:TRINITY_DN6180_c0_g1_i1.p1 TRINITY_DN6180_c0_g1~~TRINITY_DN6180_c0_g1_i1.p1  ORF type:complete len:259 (+),score=42.64 TRINITY_DN6180_c0_g1_i1:47-823(+)
MVVKVVLVLLFVGLCFCQTTAPMEIVALKAVYTATGGANWRVGWNVSKDPCRDSWVGVQCRIQDNTLTVWSLVLQGNNLIGTIPTEIALLANLQFLYLSSNYLSGSIPTEMSRLSNLIQIGFDKNLLSGSFPDLSASKNLQNIFLQDNKFTGPLDPFGKLPNLQILYLSRNSLLGTIPDSLGQLYSLQQVGVDYNMLSGAVPAGFGDRQANLQAFYGQGNNFSGTFPANLCKVALCDLSGGNTTFMCPHQGCCHFNVC